MMSLHFTARRIQSRLGATSRFLSAQIVGDISKFMNQVSTFENENKLVDISIALGNSDSQLDIIKQTCAMCSENIEAAHVQQKYVNLWNEESTLPDCTYTTLLRSSVAANNLDQLTSLLRASNDEPRVASTIGVGRLFEYYLPFTANDTNDDAIEVMLFRQFLKWAPHMNRETTLHQSQVFFNGLLSLYDNDWDRMVNFIDRHIAAPCRTGHIAETDKNTLTSFDKVRATTLLFTAYDFLAAHDIAKATEFIKNVKHRRNFKLSSLALGQYSDSVSRSIPLAWSASSPDTEDSTDSSRGDKAFKKRKELKRQKHYFIPESVEVDISLAAYIDQGVVPVQAGDADNKGVDFELIKSNLDNLFYLAEGASDAEKTLRHVFYKKLLNFNRPRTLLSYEKKRCHQESLYYQSNGEMGSPLSLDVEGYKCVIRAHANQFDANGILTTLSEWNQIARLISTSSVEVASQSPFAVPDSTLYKTIISIFNVHPHMITHANVEKFFEQMQHDNVTPADNKDIIALVRFANKAESVTVMNTLLEWISSMMDAESSSDRTSDIDSSSDFNSDFLNSQIPKKSFSAVELVSIYDMALETNSSVVDNGDKCLDILFTMKNRGIVLNGNRVALVMKALKNSKNFDAVLELFHSMSALKVKRDTYHVSLAVVAYVRTDQVAKGLALLDRFESAGQNLKNFAYFAAAFEIMRRLCVKPYFVPFTVSTASGETVELSQREAIIKCVDLFLFAMKNEDLFAGSKNHLKTSIKLLDPFIYVEMIQYMEERIANAPSEAQATTGSSALPPAAERLLLLFKELKKAVSRGQSYR